MAHAQARLTVLLPTYNRAASLPRAIRSVLDQTQSDLELLISDNASDDDTRAMCEGFAARDARVTYFRQPVNRGPIANFNWLLSRASTEFTLLLADDDWLDADYVERCVAIMDGDRRLSAVMGATRYFEGDTVADRLLNDDIPATSGGRRVLQYLRSSSSSAAFYGLLRTSGLHDALPIPNVMGADWIFVSALAFSGPMRTTADTHLNRARGGASADFQRIAAVSGLSTRAARNPHLSIAFNQFRDIAFSSPAYSRLGSARRLMLGFAAAAVIVASHTFDVLWDAVGPLIMHRRLIGITGPLRDWSRARRAG